MSATPQLCASCFGDPIDAIIHFAGSIVVPESVSDPLGYYLNNTCKSRALIACAVETKVKHFIFSSTAAVYGMPESYPVAENARPKPISPYGKSKLMTEIMLRDTAHAHNFRYVALRYFNVAGADPRGRGGQSTSRATHLIKVACEAALGQRPYLEVFGTDYPTPDGTCVRDYIHVSDLTSAHLAALRHFREGGESEVLNCGYGHGFSVLEVITSVKHAPKSTSPSAWARGGRATLRRSWQRQVASARFSAGSHGMMTSIRSLGTRLTGKSG